MRFAVEYEGKYGRVGLIIFSADNLNNAQIYVEELIDYHGHTDVFNLNQVTNGSIDEINHLFPRLTTITDRKG